VRDRADDFADDVETVANRGGRDAAGLTLLDGVTQQTAELESTNAATATEWLRGSDANRCVAVVGIMRL
jgi:hypothetical protein